MSDRQAELLIKAVSDGLEPYDVETRVTVLTTVLGAVLADAVFPADPGRAIINSGELIARSATLRRLVRTQAERASCAGRA